MNKEAKEMLLKQIEVNIFYIQHNIDSIKREGLENTEPYKTQLKKHETLKAVWKEINKDLLESEEDD